MRYALTQQRAVTVSTVRRSWRQPVATLSALPAADNMPGDARVATDTGTAYVWTDAEEWEALTGGGGAALSDVAPAALGVAAAGVAAAASRGDHVHTMPSAANVGAQAVDADLTALAALGSTGLVTRTAAATYAERTLASSSSGLVVANGDGVAGAPSLSLAALLQLISALTIAKGGILTASGSQTPAVLAVGADGRVPSALASEATGIEWADVPAPIHYRSGVVNDCWHVLAGTLSGATAWANGNLATNYAGKLTAFQFIPGKDMTLEAIGLLITTGVGGAFWKIAVYADTGDCYPGALVGEFDELDCTTNGRKNSTGKAFALKRGRTYWFVCWGAVGSTARFVAIASGTCPLGIPNDTTSTPGQSWRFTSAYTAGASTFAATHPTFPAGATVDSNSLVLAMVGRLL